MKLKKKWIALGAAAVVAAALLVFTGPTVSNVLKSASIHGKGTPVVDVPQINDGFVPQGLEFDGDASAGTGRLYISGYEKDGGVSPVFAYDFSEGVPSADALSATLSNEAGEEFSEHGGGITVDKRHVFVAGDSVVLVFDRKEFDSALDAGGQAKAIASIDAGFAPAFVEVHDGKLWIGEYYHEPQYSTSENHHISTASGANHSVMVAYAQDEESPTGYSSKPCEAMSLPDMAQGVCFVDDNRLLVSCSWGLDSSQIVEYDLASSGVKVLNINGAGVPLTILESQCEVARVDVPLFAEEVVMLCDRLLINSEAACNKYYVGKLYGAQTLRSYDLSELKGR